MFQFFWQSIFFIGIQLLGILTAVRIRNLQAKGVIDIDVTQVAVPPDMEPWRFLIVLVIFIIGVILVVKLPRSKGLIFKLIFSITAFWGGGIVLSIWIPGVIAFGIAIAAILFWLWKGTIILHNILITLSIAGIGGVFGFRFVPESVIFFMIIFSVYDIIAVYVTKHMVKLLKAMMEARALIAIVVPDKISRFSTRIKDIQSQKGFMMLGGGDVAFPTMLVSSVSADSLDKALVIALFSFTGLFLTFVLFNVFNKKPMPALPPIAIMSILGFVVTNTF